MFKYLWIVILVGIIALYITLLAFAIKSTLEKYGFLSINDFLNNFSDDHEELFCITIGSIITILAFAFVFSLIAFTK